jgi:hypothetical protein
MTTSSGRKHAGPGPASDQPPVPEPTFAERARTLMPKYAEVVQDLSFVGWVVGWNFSSQT